MNTCIFDFSLSCMWSPNSKPDLSIWRLAYQLLCPGERSGQFQLCYTITSMYHAGETDARHIMQPLWWQTAQWSTKNQLNSLRKNRSQDNQTTLLL